MILSVYQYICKWVTSSRVHCLHRLSRYLDLSLRENRLQKVIRKKIYARITKRTTSRVVRQRVGLIRIVIFIILFG